LLSEYHGLTVELNNLFERGTFVDKEINGKNKSFQNSCHQQSDITEAEQPEIISEPRMHNKVDRANSKM
jgi:hypothetical protein